MKGNNDRQAPVARLRRRQVWIPIAAIAVLLIAAYVILSVFFMSHFFFGTTINGMRVSGYSAGEVQTEAEDILVGYQLAITDVNGDTYTIRGTDFGLSQHWNTGIGDLVKKQNGFAWLAKVFAPDELELAGAVVFDESKLRSLLKSQAFMSKEAQKAPVNAKLSDYTEDGYKVIPSEPGSTIDEEKLILAVEKTILSLKEEVDLVEEDCYVKPQVGDEDEQLLAKVKTLNDYASSAIEYDLGEKEEVLDINTFKDWLHMSEDGAVTIDEEKVAEYAASLSKKYNTCYSAKKFKSTWGDEVKIENSHYGWKVDEEAEKAQILEDLRGFKKVKREINYSMTANTHGENDYGDSYVEVNITQQHLYLYKDGKAVLDTDFVSGNLSKGYSTPSGIYSLTYKQKDAVLRGANYASEVKYWMPFYENYGMHDASWRSSFGGSIYKTNGSHGCVNLPTSVAEKIFEVVEKGWPVIVYRTAAEPEVKLVEQKKDSSAVQAAKKKASEVDSQIRNATKKVTEESAKAVAAARASYDKLSDTEKKYVSNYKLLTTAEKTLKELQDSEADTETDSKDTKKDSKDTKKDSKDTKDTKKDSKDTKKDTKKDSGESKDTKKSSESSKDTKKSSESSKDTKKSSESSKDTKKSSESSKDTKKSSESSKDTKKSSESSKDTKKSSESSKDTKKSSESSKDTKKSTESSKDTKKSSESSKDTKKSSESSKDTKKSTESSKDTKKKSKSTEKESKKSSS